MRTGVHSGSVLDTGEAIGTDGVSVLWPVTS